MTLAGINQFDNPGKLRDRLRGTRVEPCHEVSDSEVAEAQDRRSNLLISATDRIGTLAEVARHGNVAAGGPDQRRRVPPNISAGLVDRGHLGHDRIGIPVPDRVPGIGVAGDDPQHATASRADQDGSPSGARSARSIDGVAGLEELTLEVDVFATQERVDDRHRLLEATDPPIEGKTERVVLWLVPACAQSEDDTTPADVVDRLGHLGDQTRIAETGAGYQ